MKIIKRIIRRTFLYEFIKLLQARKVLTQWTAQDQEMLKFYQMFVPQGSLCFDIGANIGTRVKIFLKLQARVVAVEPQIECVKILRTVYRNNRNLTIIQNALGEGQGEAEIMISNANTISSLSPVWIEAVRKSGRFSEFRWDRKQIVTVTTLDKLIEQYGMPSFIKIDVEGFEYQVVEGLSQPVKALSLEFTPEIIESTFNCIKHLQRLGDIRLNYSVGETMCLALENWITPQEMVTILSGFRDDINLIGDVYVQYQSQKL
jgi:FkbM family methyltransferase